MAMNRNSLLAAFALTDCGVCTLHSGKPSLWYPSRAQHQGALYFSTSLLRRGSRRVSIRAGDDGKREKGASLLCSLFPSCPAPPLFLSPQLPHNTKRPLRRRESQYRSQIHPSDLVTSINCLLIMSIHYQEKQGGKGVFRNAWWRVRLARFARVRLLRHALPISLLILREKPTVLQSMSGGTLRDNTKNGSLSLLRRG